MRMESRLRREFRSLPEPRPRLRWVAPASCVAALLLLPLMVAAVLRARTAVHRQQTVGHAALCRENLGRLGAAFGQYALDNAGRYPPADAWADSLLSYTGGEDAFRCPADPKRSRSSYAFYAALGGLAEDDLDSPADTPVLYDSMRGLWNARDSRPEPCSPARHNGFNNVLMADGAVVARAPYAPFSLALGAAGFESEEGARTVAPAFPGPTLLCVSPELGVRLEYPADWTVERSERALTFRPPGGAEGLYALERHADAPNAPAAGLPADAVIEEEFQVEIAVLGSFPMRCAGAAVREGDELERRVVVPVSPPLLLRMRGTDAVWEANEAALYLVVGSLQVEPKLADAADKGVESGD